MDDIYSDTEQTVSFNHKMKNLRNIQIVALLFCTLCLMLVILSLMFSVQEGIMKYFNPIENTRQIFYIKKGERRRSLFVDLNKTIVILIAIIMHIVTCADSPRSTAYVSHINFAKGLLRNIIIQVITFESGFNALAFVR